MRVGVFLSKREDEVDKIREATLRERKSSAIGTYRNKTGIYILSPILLQNFLEVDSTCILTCENQSTSIYEH